MASKDDKKEGLSGFTLGEIGDEYFNKREGPRDVPTLTPEEAAKLLEGDDDKNKGGNDNDDNDTNDDLNNDDNDNTDDDNDDVDDDNDDDNDDDKDDVDDNKGGIVDDSTSDGDDEELKQFEGEMATHLMSRFAEEVGWTLTDDDKFEDVGDVIDYLQKVVDVNSTPEYANDEVKQFDDFVKQGGSLRGFYNEVYAGKVDPKDIDLEVEENQRSVIREDLRNSGYKDDRINKIIGRYEEAGILDEQAQDALDSIKEFNTRKEQKLLKDAEKFDEEQRKEKQKFFTDVQLSIKDLNDIRGIKVTDTEKEDLLSYIFKTDSEGVTRYQRDYADNLTKNLIESAYFTKNMDKFMQAVQRKADKKSVREMRDKMKDSKGRRTTNSKSQEENQKAPSLLSFSEMFTKP